MIVHLSEVRIDFMTLDEIKASLQKSGIPIKSETRLGNDTGTQLRLNNGAIRIMEIRGYPVYP